MSIYNEILNERKKHDELTPLPPLWLNGAHGKKVSTTKSEQRAEIVKSLRDITGAK